MQTEAFLPERTYQLLINMVWIWMLCHLTSATNTLLSCLQHNIQCNQQVYQSSKLAMLQCRYSGHLPAFKIWTAVVKANWLAPYLIHVPVSHLNLRELYNCHVLPDHNCASSNVQGCTS